MRLAIALTLPLLIPSAWAQPRLITDFTQAGEARRWMAVNDGVMGGRSKGGPSIADGVLTFQGTISLANNGGFSSTRMRSQRPRLDLSRYDGIAIRVRGTDRESIFSLRTDQRTWTGQVAYWQRFRPTGEWQIIRLPFSKFVPTSYGRKLSGRKLDPRKIDSVGLMMYDKKAGPFRLQLDWVKAYRGDEPLEAPSAKTEVSERNAAKAKKGAAKRAASDIVAVASKAGSFKTLLAAAKAAGLVDALRAESKSGLTILAPTDAAFGKLPSGLVAKLLEPENRAKLQTILKQHVLPRRLSAAQLATAGTQLTLAGQPLATGRKGGALTAGEATLTAIDIKASNGVIHVIDRVILPELRDLAERADAAKTFKTLIAAAKAAHLVPALKGDKPLTVFAPTDAAFAKLGDGAIKALLADKAKLRAVLLRHVVPGRIRLADALAGRSLQPLAGEPLVASYNGGARVAGASIASADIEARNGIIHVIDQVILPPKQPETSAASGVDPQALITQAIEIGVPLFNDGNPDACRAVYQIAAIALASNPALTKARRKALSQAVTQARRENAVDGAWTLRRQLDAAYAELQRSAN